MHFIQHLLVSRTLRQLDGYAQVIARRCQRGVLDRLGDSALAMSEPEVRGYVRARAAQVVRSEVDLVLSRRTPLPTWVRGELIARTTEKMIPQVVLELMAKRTLEPAVRLAG